MFIGLFVQHTTSPIASFEMESNAPLLDRHDSQAEQTGLRPASSPPHLSPNARNSPTWGRSSSNSWTAKYLGKGPATENGSSRRGTYMTLPTNHEDEELGIDDAVEPWVVTSHPQDDAPGLQRYTRKAIWLLLLLSGYAVARAGSWFGIPQDGSKDLDPYDLQDDLTKLFLFGIVLDWFARVTAEDRFAWLFHWRRWYFFAFFYGTPPVYGIISNQPGLQHSFADISDWGVAQWCVVVGGVSTLLGLVAYHVTLAFKWKNRGEAVAYVLSRCLVYIFFGLTTALVMHDDRYKLHLHHLYLGWAFALFAEFNTPLSAITLAVTTGIFVQGIGAYSFADNLYNSNCFSVDFGNYQSMSCAYTVPKTNVTMRVCPAQAGVKITAKCQYTL